MSEDHVAYCTIKEDVCLVLIKKDKRIAELEKQLAFEYQDDDTKTITLKKALEEKDEKAKAIERGNECTRALLRDCTKILENKHREVADLKKALEEAREEAEELRYRFRLCGIDNPLPADEEKNYKFPLHYCPHGIRITETCVDCGRKA